ncbi:helix-turn-helix domain-containing protein [Candidatus Soleaferrea massiliensis]|uniref:helix-turn-helix domain-containing protein n=1 Tax=Candidatus Soleaferrea massiliensis TaxID=1470354 RepID=UPI00058BF762|nr:helix-turn-helix transcriptional regulator [Candidatus Soleaferrea massiliensis]
MAYERIRQLREDSDRTQRQIANLLYVSQQTYSSYENGVSTPSPDILIALAKIHRTSVDYILGLTDDPRPPERSKRK